MNNEERIRALAQVIETNDLKCFSAKMLSDYFASIADTYRYDQVIRCVGQAMEKKAFDNPNSVITGQELSQIANQFAGLGSVDNFKKVCADLLPVSLTEEDSHTQEHLESSRHNYFEDGSRIPSKEAQLEVDEFDLAKTEVPNVLASVFDKKDMKLAHVAVPEELINRGEYLVADELKGLGLNSAVAYTVCNNDTLLYTASIDTEIGKQIIYVPVEMANNQVLYPTSFTIADRIFELSKEGVQQFLNVKRAQHEIKQNRTAMGSRDTFLTDIAREVKASDGSIEVDEHTLAEQDLTNNVKMPEALIPVAEILENSLIRKESKYNDSEINLVIGMVRDELTKLGYANSTIKFEGDHEKGLSMSATVQTPEGKFDIMVPVEASDGRALIPTVFSGVRDMNFMKRVETEKAQEENEEEGTEEEVEITSASYDLSKEGFQKFIASNLENAIPVRYSSDLVDLHFNDLRKIVHKAVADKRYAVAEQALSVIADKYGVEHHATAMEDYQKLLTGATLDYKDNFGSTMRATTNFEEVRDSWVGEMVTSQIKLT